MSDDLERRNAARRAVDQTEERRHGERRRSSWLYWVIGALFVVFVALLFAPAEHVPMWTRIALVCVIGLLCLFDRRGITQQQLTLMTLLMGLGSGGLLIITWHTPQRVLWVAITMLLLAFSVGLYAMQSDRRRR